MKPFRQILFNYILSEMKRQDWVQATTEDGSCAYLTSDGLRCAVGVCLPKRYDDRWISQKGGLSTLTYQRYDIVPKFISAHSSLLSRMQYWHDNGFSVGILRGIASDYKLEIPEDLMPPTCG